VTNLTSQKKLRKLFQNTLIILGLEVSFSLSSFRLDHTKKVFVLDAQESFLKSIEYGNKKGILNMSKSDINKWPVYPISLKGEKITLS